MRAYVQLQPGRDGEGVMRVWVNRGGRVKCVSSKRRSSYQVFVISVKVERMQKEGRCVVVPLTDGFVGWEARIE